MQILSYEDTLAREALMQKGSEPRFQRSHSEDFPRVGGDCIIAIAPTRNSFNRSWLDTQVISLLCPLIAATFSHSTRSAFAQTTPTSTSIPVLRSRSALNISEAGGWGQDAAVLLTTGQRVRVQRQRER